MVEDGCLTLIFCGQMCGEMNSSQIFVKKVWGDSAVMLICRLPVICESYAGQEIRS